jgi:hypothetical protein
MPWLRQKNDSCLTALFIFECIFPALPHRGILDFERMFFGMETGAMRPAVIAAILALITCPAIYHPAAAACTAADFASAVDQSGASLRGAALETQPKLQDRMRRYQAAKGLSDSDYEAAAIEAIVDQRLQDLDTKSSELLLKIDGLGRVPDGKEPNCAELDEIKALSSELLVVVRTKSEYMLAKLDAKLGDAGGKKPVEQAAEKPAEKNPEKQAAKAADPKPEKSAKSDAEPWDTKTKSNDAYVPPPVAQSTVPAPAPDAVAPVDGDGYSIDEVRDATRGFFGTISTSLASVIEHAFKTSGRPTAYVLGTEGGGAFLAGLRFGDGTLYMRNSPRTRKVWWHGPSLGTDFGASGTRTMFLIYKLTDQEALFRTYTGIDGSAFLVGGVGMTVLKGGDVIMAPIRSGLGLRVGASIGYVRFTQQPTWNPF